MTPRYSTEIARIVKAARLAKGESQVQFAITLGCSQALISKYEAGKVMPSADVIIHCMHISGVCILIQDEESRQDPRWSVVYEAMGRLALALRSAQTH